MQRCCLYAAGKHTTGAVRPSTAIPVQTTKPVPPVPSVCMQFGRITDLVQTSKYPLDPERFGICGLKRDSSVNCAISHFLISITIPVLSSSYEGGHK